MKKRGVLSLWKVIILVIVGVLAVAGVAVLGFYLANGGFGEKPVEPNDFSFVRDVDEGEAYFNESLDRFETSSDFSLTITSTTEGVTERDVTLSLQNGRTYNADYITDGIVIVPQTVRIGTPFEVTLYQDYNAEIFQDWPVGGTSVLTARSTNIELVPQTVTINVDVPVSTIDVSVSGTEQQGLTQDVVIGTNFTLDTTFSPEKSQYLFSDETREKEIFYSFTKSYISYDWESGRFYANQRSGNNFDTITVSTFKNSYYQWRVMNEFANITEDRELLTSQVLRYFEQHPETCVSTTVNVRVLDVDVDSVTVGNADTTFDTYLDQYFTLTASSANGNGNLDLTILDSSGGELPSLYGNIGIKIPKNQQGLKILGGDVMEVVTADDGAVTITRLPFDQDFDYATAPDGTEYYILANSTPQSYDDYFWRMASSEETIYTLSVNFFFENEEGMWQNFFAFNGQENLERSFVLNAETKDNEDPPSFVNNDTITLTINYDENGNVVPASIRLDSRLAPVNSENIYRTVKYFLLIDTTVQGYAEIDINDVFVCGQGATYNTNYLGQTLQISNAIMPPEGYYTLYEIDDDSVLTAIKSFSGTVKVVAATIRTDADNRPYITEDGKYLIVNTSRAQEVMVESTLSIANMTPSVVIDATIMPNVDHNNDYYIPAVNRNETGSQRNMLTFNLVLSNSEDPETDAQKVIDAFNAGNLQIACLDMSGQTTNQYITWQGLVRTGIEGTSITFEGSLAIEENFFAAGRTSLDMGTYIRLQLQYNDGNEIYTKPITISGNDAGKDYFYVYYQQPVLMEAEFESANDLDNDGDGVVDDIIVNISAAEGVTITWGDRVIEGTAEQALAQLNELLTFTLTDQFGNIIQDNTNIYSVRLVETTTDGIEDEVLSLDSNLEHIQNFISTQGKTRRTSLTAHVVNREGNEVFVFDEDGNVTTQPMISQALNFVVQSEGIQRLEYDTTDTVGVVTDDDYISSDDLSRATVEKYVTSNQTIDLNTLLRIYTSGNDGELNLANDVVYKLDESFVSSLSATNRQDIMDMISFNDDAGLEEDETDDITNYRNMPISTLNIINPFREDTHIIFSVRDSAEALFDITLVLILKADIEVRQNFNTYYEQNAEYLVTSGNSISVFAGQSYDLADYVTLTSHLGNPYSWADVLSGLSLNSDVNGVFYATEDFCSLSIVQEGDGDHVYLNISDIYQFDTVTFTLYYGKNSYYACSVTVTLYINPNIVIRQRVSDLSSNPFVDLENISSLQLSSSFQLFRFTSYIENGGFDGAEEIVSNATPGNIVFVYNNISTNVYLNIIRNTTVANSYIYTFEDGKTLNLTLGQKVEQTYRIDAQVWGSSTVQTLDAAKILDAGDETQIVLCEESGAMTISLDIGFGGENVNDMASSVLRAEDGERVNVVTYNGQTYLLLMQNSTYLTQNDFVITQDSATGNLYSDIQNSLRTNPTISGYVSLTGNAFSAEKRFVDTQGHSLTITVALNAIVSKIGDRFVYYNNGALPDDEGGMIFNNFENVDFSTIIGDYTALEEDNVYQQLQAGKTYTIVHDISKTFGSTSDAFGFYFDGDSTLINSGDAIYELSIVTTAQGYVNGLAVLESDEEENVTKLKLNHLESSMTDIYVVLRLNIHTYDSESFSWYYRVKVSPSFTNGTVTYPYGDGGEYLDIYSNYYDSETQTYTIDLEENFNAQNSRYDSGKRFGDVAQWETDLEEGQQLTSTYIIKSASIGEKTLDIDSYRQYFTYNFEDGVFNIKLVDNTSKLTIIIEKSFAVDGHRMIGSELQYIIYFNQGLNYVHSVTQIDGGKETPLVDTDNDQRYSSTIYAGSNEVQYNTNIRISSNGTESTVSEYWAYISGENDNLISSLKAKVYIKAGSTLYTDATGNTSNGTVEKDIIIGDWQNSIDDFADDPTIITLNDGDNTYYVSKESVGWTFAYLDASHCLHIMPQQTVSQDRTYEIGFYTQERVVFRIDLTVSSYFKWTINDSAAFVGGQRYEFVGENNTIFSNLSIDSSLSQLTVLDLDIALLNGEEAFDENLTLSDLVFINNDAQTYQENTIEFAHLTNDVTFEFLATITDSDQNKYSFTFEIEVSSSFVINQTRRATDNAEHYGTLSFAVSMEELRGYISNLLPLYDAEDTRSAYQFVSTDGSFVDEMSIVPENVANETRVDHNFNLVYLFNSQEIFRFTVIYRYRILPNVVVTPHYPKPDGTNEIDTEYIATTQGADETYSTEVIESFFTSPAMFATENRIVVANVDAISTENITNNWNISVSSISNATVLVTGDVLKNISADSEDMTIVTGVDNVSGIDLQFRIINSSSNASVSFDVTVNNVNTTYSVVIVAGSVIQISTNTPNYLDNREVVYAEDLTRMASANLFAQNRILRYEFSDSAQTNTTYYLRLINGTNEVQIIDVTNDNSGLVNYDLGRSFGGYEYVGTFLTRESAVAGSSAENDENLYIQAPSLTSRIVAYYYDRTPITFDDDIILRLTQDSVAENAEDFELSVDDYGRQISLSISIQLDGQNIETNGIYNLELDIEFEVTGNADSLDYTTVDINAGEEHSLLSYSAFGITNTRTGQAYDQISMTNSAGNITLQIYGFTDLPVDLTGRGSDELAKAAGEIHNTLISTDGKGPSDIVYSTGLSPRAGVPINVAENGGDVSRNFISISGVRAQGKNVDFLIQANGANNDGNYVMMKLTYSVEIGGRFITKSHNILFRVLPNSQIRFKSQQEDAQNYINSANEIENGQSIASNSNSPYAILLSGLGQSGTTVSFNLWTTLENQVALASTVVANMYGQTDSSANEFTYTYTQNIRNDYNETNADGDSYINFGTNSGWTGSNGNYTSDAFDAENLAVTLSKINLGEKNFIIQAENDFGYKLNFYFTMTAEVNPVIYNADSTITEGDSIGVGLRFQTVTPAGASTTSTTVTFNAFEYVQSSDMGSGSQYINTITIALKNNTYSGNTNYSITGASLAVTLDSAVGQLQAGSVLTKTWIDLTVQNAQITLTICNNDEEEWYFEGENYALTQENLSRASCVLSLTIVRQTTWGEDNNAVENTRPVGSYTVTYNETELRQVQTIASGYTEPNFIPTDIRVESPDASVSLSGISAYGYANRLGAVNEPDASVSSMGTIKVKQIEFYLGETWLGGTYQNSSGAMSTNNITTFNSATKEEVSLITNTEYSFISENGSTKEISRGEGYDEDKEFVVPVISGVYYGTGTTISNVRMAITLIDVSGTASDGETCVVNQYVTLQREPSDNLFASSTIYDTNSPTVNAGNTILNDTLEVVLDPGESIKFVVNDTSISALNEEDGILTCAGGTKTARIVSFTNNTNTNEDGGYTTIEYVGISASVVDLNENFASGDSFYIDVIDSTGSPTINYNGRAIENLNGRTGTTIARYTNNSGALVQHIESEDELLSSNSKTETLYFLHQDNGQTYQYSQTFTIVPLYSSATSSSLFGVTNYYRMSNGDSTYYLVSLSSWGTNVTLHGQNDTTLANIANSNESFKFVFEISTGDGGAGSAFIDEKGLVTTSTDIALGTHTFTVNVYMKMSGQNGAFEEESTRIRLGSFRFFLNSANNPTTQVTSTAGIYTVNGDVIVVPSGYTLYANRSLSTQNITQSFGNLTSFATNVGEEVDFENIYGSVVAGTFGYNRSYHLVSYRLNGATDTNYISFDNLNSYRFTNAGNYAITVVVTGRTSVSGQITARYFTSEIIVYNTSTREEQAYFGRQNDHFTEAFDTAYTWYLLNSNGTIQEVTDFTSSEIGIFTMNYLAQPSNGGQSRLVTKTFYIYGADEQDSKAMSVVLIPSSTFQLSNLVSLQAGQSVEFYRIDSSSIESVISETLSLGVNRSTTYSYIVAIRENGEYTSIQKYAVTYKVSSSTQTSEGVYIGENDNVRDVITNEVASGLGIEQANITSVEIIGTGNILTEENRTAQQMIAGENLMTGRYLITYTDSQGVTRFARYNFTFYVYHDTPTGVDEITYQTVLNNAFTLSALNSQIAEEVLGDVSLANSILGYYQLTDNGIQQVTTIMLEEDTTATYYVRTADAYYLITVNFTIQ